jgi:hypothetical protein
MRCLDKTAMRGEKTVFRKKTAMPVLGKGAWGLAMVARTLASFHDHGNLHGSWLLHDAASQSQLADLSMKTMVALLESSVKP